MEISLDYSPHENQKKVHRALEDPQYNFISLVASRQFGKTKLMQMSVIQLMFNDDRFKTCWIVSPTDANSNKLFTNMYDGLSSAHLVKSHAKKSGDYSIKLINNKTIKFKSAKSENSLRGASVDFMVIDESAFIPGDIIYKVLMPMIITKKQALMFCISTPNGRSNWFFDFHQNCSKNENGNSKSFLFTYKDNPLVNLDLIKQFKETLPDHIFKQEFECSFNDASTVFSNVNELGIGYDELIPFNKVYVGIDIGMKNDYTVVSIITDKGQMIDMLRITGIDIDDLINRINDFLTKYRVDRILIENNNQGIVVAQLLRKTWNEKLVEFNTNAKTKPEIITRLITAFSGKRFQYLRDMDNGIEFINELNDFAYKIDPGSGKVKYEAMSGHDDIVMATAIAYHCYLKRNSFEHAPIVIM
jgi:hypothetical protein